MNTVVVKNTTKSIHSTQKVIRVGSSDGITLPAKELKRAGISAGDEVEVTVRKAGQHNSAQDKDVLDTAKGALKRYKQDFDNLAQR